MAATTALRGEAKRFALRPARKPKVHHALSGTVLVVAPGIRGMAYIHFGEALVDAVGGVAKRGLGVDTPGYLKVMNMRDGSWRVFFHYLEDDHGLLLWEHGTQPAWLVIRNTMPGTVQNIKEDLYGNSN